MTVVEEKHHHGLEFRDQLNVLNSFHKAFELVSGQMSKAHLSISGAYLVVGREGGLVLISLLGFCPSDDSTGVHLDGNYWHVDVETLPGDSKASEAIAALTLLGMDQLTREDVVKIANTSGNSILSECMKSDPKDEF